MFPDPRNGSSSVQCYQHSVGLIREDPAVQAGLGQGQGCSAAARASTAAHTDHWGCAGSRGGPSGASGEINTALGTRLTYIPSSRAAPEPFQAPRQREKGKAPCRTSPPRWRARGAAAGSGADLQEFTGRFNSSFIFGSLLVLFQH